MTEPKRWIILRCSGPKTLRLAESLKEDGFEVWTPIVTKIITVPRVNVKRAVSLSIFPGYIFAREAHLVDLLELAAMPVKPRRGASCQLPALADFSVLRLSDRIAMVRDASLKGLRDEETRRTERPLAPPIAKGAKVRVSPDEPRGFGGMVGVVRRSDDCATLVCFSRWFDKVEIPTSLLTEDEAYQLQSSTDHDRKAA